MTTTGIGRYTFSIKNPDKTKQWYKENLGFDTDAYGATFKFRPWDDPSKTVYIQWSPMSEKNKLFGRCRSTIHGQLSCQRFRKTCG